MVSFNSSPMVKCARKPTILTLRELKACACAFLPVLLPLDHSRIASQKSCFFQGRFQGFIRFDECACESVRDCACLSGMSAAFYIDVNSEFAAFLNMLNWALCFLPMVSPLEVFLNRFLIDGNPSFTAGDNPDARY